MFVLETTDRETGKVARTEFKTCDERINAFAHVDVHTHAYRFEEAGEDAP